MTIPRSTAKKLCTETEYRLVNESFAPLVSQLNEKGLAQRIQRARIARDKYRSLAQRQTREARGRLDPRGARGAAGNKNTVTKQQLFDEALARYEKQAERTGRTQVASRQIFVAGKKKPAASEKSSVASTASKVSKQAATRSSASKQAASPAAAKSGKTEAASKKAGKLTKADKQAPASEANVKKAEASQADAARQSGKQAAGKGVGEPVAPSGAGRQSSVSTAGTKKKSSTLASHAGTITQPVKIPPLTQVVAAVSQVVESRKEESYSATPAQPARSRKAPAQTHEGAPLGMAAAAEETSKGPNFSPASLENGRLAATFKRPQAQRDSR